jgi:hypothetical protein
MEIVDKIPQGVNLQSLQVCQATKSDGTPCKAHPVIGTPYCRVHGGKIARGMLSPSARTGRYSKYIPSGLRRLYDEGLDDPDILSLEADIHLIDARILELLEGLEEYHPSKSWSEIRNLIGTLQLRLSELSEGIPPKEITEVIERMEKLSSAEISKSSIWNETLPLIDTRRKLSESESHRLQAMGQYIPVEKAMAMIQDLSIAVKKNVHDSKTLAQISQEFVRITHGRLSPFIDDDLSGDRPISPDR